MSLLSTASIWSNEEQPKKRIPTMRKTVRATKHIEREGGGGGDDEQENIRENYQNLQPSTVEENASYQQDRNQKVNEL